MNWDLLLMKLAILMLNALMVAAVIGFIVTVKHDLYMMKETKHRRDLELLDKQIELERVLRMPLVATAPYGVLPAPETDQPEPGKEVPDVPAPPA